MSAAAPWPAPPDARDWPAMADTAQQLLDARRRRDPARVASGEITAEQAEARLRIMGAIATQWRAVVDRAALPEFDTTWREMREDLDQVAREALAHAAAHPADATFAAFALRVDALAWQQRPPCGSAFEVPHIVTVHLVNQQARAERIARAAA